MGSEGLAVLVGLCAAELAVDGDNIARLALGAADLVRVRTVWARVRLRVRIRFRVRAKIRVRVRVRVR